MMKDAENVDKCEKIVIVIMVGFSVSTRSTLRWKWVGELIGKVELVARAQNARERKFIPSNTKKIL